MVRAQPPGTPPPERPTLRCAAGTAWPRLLRINQGQEWYEFPPAGPIGPQGGCFWRIETRQHICGDFLTAWLSSGLELDGVPGFTREENLALFGLPLTGVITETLSDGNVYEVQYFERAHFEYHPDNNPHYNVLFGLLGNETYAYVLPSKRHRPVGIVSG